MATRLRAPALAAAVAAADLALKAVVTASIAPGDRVHLLPAVDLVSSRNSGIAFGLLAGVPSAALITLGLAIVCVLARVAWSSGDRGVWIPAAVLAGGALANLADRARGGGVIDYLELPRWPAFNLADAAITAGAIALVLGLTRSERPTRPGGGASADSEREPGRARAS